MLIRLAAITAALLVSTASGAVELTDPVPGHPDKTYADLVGQFVEGFKLGEAGAGTANITNPIRYVDEPEATEGDADPRGGVSVLQLDATPFRSGGETMLAVKVDLDAEPGGWPIVVLGTFGPDLKLVDSARIDLDSIVMVESPLAISDKDDGLLVRSTHFNAGENYQAAQLVYLTHGELTALPALYGYSVMMCGFQDTETIAFSAADDGQPGFRAITATLTIDHTVDSQCDPTADAEDPEAAPAFIEAPWTRSATATYVWSASIGGYIEQSETISALEAELGYDDGEGTDESPAESDSEGD